LPSISGSRPLHAIKKRDYDPTPEDARRIVEWIDGCEVAWIACPTPRAAKDLERDMKAEYKPPLTRR
jgi:hypothetical protein